MVTGGSPLPSCRGAATAAFCLNVGTLFVTGGTGRSHLQVLRHGGRSFMANPKDKCGQSGTVNLRTLGFVLDKAGAMAANAAGIKSVPFIAALTTRLKIMQHRCQLIVMAGHGRIAARHVLA